MMYSSVFERLISKDLKRDQKFQFIETVIAQSNSLINRFDMIVFEGLKHAHVEKLSQMSEMK